MKDRKLQLGKKSLSGRHVGYVTEEESNVRDYLIVRLISGLGRNLVPGKLPEIHKDNHSQDS